MNQYPSWIYISLLAVWLTGCPSGPENLPKDNQPQTPEGREFPPRSLAYLQECSGLPSIATRDTRIDSANVVDPNRCVLWYQGLEPRLGARANEQRLAFHVQATEGLDGLQVAFPYLAWISGDFRLEGPQAVDEWYFPALEWVAGSIRLDFNPALEYVDLPRLESAQQLTVYFRSNNQDLHGLDHLTSLQQLHLINPWRPDEPELNDIPLLNGLQGLTELGGLQIDGGSVQNPMPELTAAGGFLEALQQVQGDVEISVLGMQQLYGLGSITTIGGHLWLDGPSQQDEGASLLENLQGLENLQSVSGELRLQNLAQLETVNGIGAAQVAKVSLINLPNLGSLAGFEHLRIRPGGRLLIENSTQIDCASVADFIAAHAYPLQLNLGHCE